MTCREGATDLGAYVLGALDPVESRRMEQHVLDCPACAAELEELAALPPLLATVPLDDLTDAPVTPSPDLYDRVAAAAAAERPGAGAGTAVAADRGGGARRRRRRGRDHQLGARRRRGDPHGGRRAGAHERHGDRRRATAPRSTSPSPACPLTPTARSSS